jgi:hypothetical protein
MTVREPEVEWSAAALERLYAGRTPWVELLRCAASPVYFLREERNLAAKTVINLWIALSSL